MKILYVIILFIISSCSLLPPSNVVYETHNNFSVLSIECDGVYYEVVNISEEIITKVEFTYNNELYTVLRSIVPDEKIIVASINKYAILNVFIVNNVEIYQGNT